MVVCFVAIRQLPGAWILSTQTLGSQELLGHIKKTVVIKIKITVVFSSSLMKRVLDYMCNPKLAHILCSRKVICTFSCTVNEINMRVELSLCTL